MDRIDEHLIYLLQKNARMSLKDLAKEVYLSTPAVSARIEKMEKEGIIKGYGVKIDPLKLGFHITAFINMELEPVQKPEFYPFIESIPNVIECNCVTGNYSMLMKVAFPSTIELDGFIGQLQHFGKTQTQIVFSTPVEPRGLNVEALEAEEAIKKYSSRGFYGKCVKSPAVLLSLFSFLIDQAAITAFQCSMPTACEA